MRRAASQYALGQTDLDSNHGQMGQNGQNGGFGLLYSSLRQYMDVSMHGNGNGRQNVPKQETKIIEIEKYAEKLGDNEEMVRTVTVRRQSEDGSERAPRKSLDQGKGSDSYGRRRVHSMRPLE